jgi:hypothetical protein
VRPPSVLTSTRRIGAAPDHGRPVTTCRPARRTAPNDSANALLALCRVSGGSSGQQAGPVRRYWVVFQGEDG